MSAQATLCALDKDAQTLGALRQYNGVRTVAGLQHGRVRWGLTSHNGVLVSWGAAGQHTQAGPYGVECSLVDNPPGAHHKVAELLSLQHEGGIRSSRGTVTACIHSYTTMCNNVQLAMTVLLHTLFATWLILTHFWTRLTSRTIKHND